jgi:hypothetical protein
MGRGDYAQPERLRKQPNDQGRSHDIDRKRQIQSLIVMIPAWKYLAKATEGIREPENDHEHRGTPTKIRFEVRQITR